MRLSLRFVIPLLLAIAAFAYIAVLVADTLMLRWFVRDLDIRSNLIASTVQEPLSGLIVTGSAPRVTLYFNRMLQDERLYAVGLCATTRRRRSPPPSSPPRSSAGRSTIS
jgi:trehalose 6-phosphate synthase